MKFRISSALKNIIGRDLITDDFIAIYELVKNSYDAGASKVTITFKDDKIVIVDNGKGMSETDIREKWLFVAYSAKKEGVEDFRDKAQKKRHYAGAKGIGRFSCDRLGSELQMITKTSDCDLANQIFIDWSHFEKDSKEEFVNISAKSSQVEVDEMIHGTILTITKFPNDVIWDAKKIEDLRRSLEKLVNPFEKLNRQENFVIEIVCEFPNLSGPITNQIFQKLNLKTTQIIAEACDDTITTELVDRGVSLYKIQEPNIKFDKLINVKIHLFFLNPVAKNNFTRLMGVQPVNFGSVFIFKNGFRVAPYGDKGDDSLGLDKRKSQGYARHLGSRELMGYIQIWDEGEEDFKEVSSRDGGLRQTLAYQQLIGVFLKTLRLFERYVTDISWKLESQKLKTDDADDLRYIDTDLGHEKIIDMLSSLTRSKDLKLLEFNKDFLNVLNRRVETQNSEILRQIESLLDKQGASDYFDQISKIQKQIRNLEAAKNEAEFKISLADEARESAEVAAKVSDINAKKEKADKEKAIVAYEEEKKRSLFLTSVQSRDKEDLESFMHQIVNYTGDHRQGIENTISRIKKDKFKSPEELLPKLEEFLVSSNRILETAKFATAADFRLNSGEITADIGVFIYEYLTSLAPQYQNNVAIETNAVPSSFDVTFSPMELGIILDNIINNSKKAGATKVVLEAFVAEGVYELTISDNGNGLDSEILEADRVFEKGFSRTNGSGLGLYFCKKQLEDIGGEVSLDKKSDSNEFVLKVKVERNEA